jgi:hypothetical protein
MVEYTAPIPGTANLDQITNMVCGEEAGASRFRRSTIDAQTNVAVFEELEPGEVPPPIVFLSSLSAPPDGHAICWAGPMIVSGRSMTVKAYRKASGT